MWPDCRTDVIILENYPTLYYPIMKCEAIQVRVNGNQRSSLVMFFLPSQHLNYKFLPGSSYNKDGITVTDRSNRGNLKPYNMK